MTNTNTIPSVLADYIEYYVNELMPYYKERLEKLLNDPDNWSLSKMREKGFTRFEFELKYRQHELDEYLEKNLRRDAQYFVKKLMNRVAKKCGNIVNADGLHLSGGELNGCVIGDKGSAYVYTILAGGYNIQCLHQRVLVK